MKVSLTVAHTPWVPERVESMAKLRAQLGKDWEPYREMTDRAPNHVWSERMWNAASETRSDWCLFAQDDIVVCDRLRKVVEAVALAWPDHVVSFQSFHPAAKPLLEEGHHGYTSSDSLVGTLYGMPRYMLGDFLIWRATALKPEAVENVTEDTLISLWCMVMGKKIVRPVPGIFKHRTELPSTYGNDEHKFRNPSVLWTEGFTQDQLENPLWWRQKAPLPHLGVFYPSMPDLARHAVVGFSDAEYARCKADDGTPVLLGLKHRMLAKVYTAPKYRLFIGTPYRGGITPDYCSSIFQLQRLLGLDVQNEMTLDARHEHEDLVRVRSRMLRIAHETDCTHLAFADADNAFPPEAVLGMLKTGKDFVQCPYLRRDGRGYTIRPTEKDRRSGVTAPEDIQADNTIEIEGTGFGLTILSRACMEKMLAHYGGGDLDYFDLIDGRPYPTVALFQLMIKDKILLGEDTSFCQRWRDIGGKVWLYVGNGSPIAHYGTTKFQGEIEDLGFTRAGNTVISSGTP